MGMEDFEESRGAAEDATSGEAGEGTIDSRDPSDVAIVKSLLSTLPPTA